MPVARWARPRSRRCSLAPPRLLARRAFWRLLRRCLRRIGWVKYQGSNFIDMDALRGVEEEEERKKLPREAPVTMASFPSNARAGAPLLRFVDEAR